MLDLSDPKLTCVESISFLTGTVCHGHKNKALFVFFCSEKSAQGEVLVLIERWREICTKRFHLLLVLATTTLGAFDFKQGTADVAAFGLWG